MGLATHNSYLIPPLRPCSRYLPVAIRWTNNPTASLSPPSSVRGGYGAANQGSNIARARTVFKRTCCAPNVIHFIHAATRRSRRQMG